MRIHIYNSNMKQFNSLTFVTSNDTKAQRMRESFGSQIVYKQLDLLEMQSLDVKEVIIYKAKAAYTKIQQPVIVEDTSLLFSAWGNLPGPFIKWFYQMGDEQLCRLLDPYTDRSALYEVAIGFYDGETMKIFSESSSGSIAFHPRGEGVGWKFFVYDGTQKTIAELNDEEREYFLQNGE